MGKLIDAYRFGPPGPLPLDTATSAVVGLDFKKIRTGYSGPCIRVRRSNDNAEQDIGFDVSGNLDTTALLAFTGANNGFIRTWYNQSTVGSANDANQPTAAAQPQITSLGSVVRVNGFVSPSYNRNQWLIITNNSSLDLAIALEVLFIGRVSLSLGAVSTLYDKRDATNNYIGSTLYVSTGSPSAPVSLQWFGTTQGLAPNLNAVSNNTFCMINCDATYNVSASIQINKGTPSTGAITGNTGIPVSTVNILLGGHVNNASYRLFGNMTSFLMCSDFAQSNFLQTIYKADYGL